MCLWRWLKKLIGFWWRHRNIGFCSKISNFPMGSNSRKFWKNKICAESSLVECRIHRAICDGGALPAKWRSSSKWQVRHAAVWRCFIYLVGIYIHLQAYPVHEEMNFAGANKRSLAGIHLFWTEVGSQYGNQARSQFAGEHASWSL